MSFGRKNTFKNKQFRRRKSRKMRGGDLEQQFKDGNLTENLKWANAAKQLAEEIYKLSSEINKKKIIEHGQNFKDKLNILKETLEKVQKMPDQTSGAADHGKWGTKKLLVIFGQLLVIPGTNDVNALYAKLFEWLDEKDKEISSIIKKATPTPTSATLSPASATSSPASATLPPASATPPPATTGRWGTVPAAVNPNAKAKKLGPVISPESATPPLTTTDVTGNEYKTLINKMDDLREKVSELSQNKTEWNEWNHSMEKWQNKMKEYDEIKSDHSTVHGASVGGSKKKRNLKKRKSFKK